MTGGRRVAWRLLAVVAVALVAFVAFVAERSGRTQWLDLRAADMRATFAAYEPRAGITLVDIDAASLEEVGIWPWPRSFHADLLRRAGAMGARTVAFDIDFSSLSDPAVDADFAAALSESNPETLLAAFVQPAAVGAQRLAVSLPAETFLRWSWPAGVNVPVDGDGRVRRFASRSDTGTESLSSMPSLLAGREPAGETFGINLSIDARSFDRVSYVDLLHGRVDPAAIEGRALVVGATAIELRDIFQVPGQGLISGSTIIALAAETLFQNLDIVSIPAPLWAWGLVLALGLAGTTTLRGWKAPLFLVSASCAVELAALLLHHGATLSVGTAGLQLALAGLLGLSMLHEFDLRGWLLRVSMLDASNSRRLLERVIEDGFDGIIVLDDRGRVLRSNAAARNLPLDGGRKGVPATSSGLPEEVRAAVRALRSGDGGPPSVQDVRIDCAEGTRILEFSLAPLSLGRLETAEERGEELHACLAVRDVTDIRRAQEKMRALAMEDSLTGLGNRRALEARLDEAARAQATPSLILFDLHRFKSVNDMLGHGVGDLVLAEMGARAEAALGAGAFLARIGGDEFAAVVERGDEDLEETADALRQAMDEPFLVGGHRISVGVCVGIAPAGSGPVDPGHLMQMADIALHRAKHSAGTRRVARFRPGMEEKRLVRLGLEADILRAQEKGEFDVVYQPQVDLKSGALVGAEALVRWTHPDRGSISPAVFIPLAEEMGLIHRLGNWVLERACVDAAAWQRPLRVAVNVSSVQFHAGDLERLVAAALEASALPAERLELEITESAFVRDTAELDVTFRRLGAMGIKFALDDFGTGYSSLGYLHRFPISKIKIDKSFVDGLPARPHSLAIIRSILALSNGLDIRTIAEGIETEEQAQCLRMLGCREGQGYLFHRPISAGAMQDLARSARPGEPKTAAAALRPRPSAS